MPEPLIQIEGVSKKYCRSLKRSLWYGVRDVAFEMSGRRRKELVLRPSEFLAVNDVSFGLHAGESVALMGRNGSGKSTLLKMINGLIKPDAGRITVRGRVGALIELGAGFNPLLTGRENIFINAAVLGISKREVDKRLDAIIDFAEVDDFIDAPLKSYSSGMRVRLGFAVAAQMEPEVLLIDEVLAVGDAAFRIKCYRRLSQLLEQGTAFVLVSHSHHTVMSLCNRGVAIECGSILADSNIHEAMETYESSLRTTKIDTPQISSVMNRTSGESEFQIEQVCLTDSTGKTLDHARTGCATGIRVTCNSKVPVDEVSLSIAIREVVAPTESVLGISSSQDAHWYSLPRGRTNLCLDIPELALRPGDYVAKIAVIRRPLHVLDAIEQFPFHVMSGKPMGDSLFFQPRRWHAETNFLKAA